MFLRDKTNMIRAYCVFFEPYFVNSEGAQGGRQDKMTLIIGFMGET